MPGMTSDIILEHAASPKRLIIDTKFTSIFGRSQHREAVLRSGYIYQTYAYLRSQERPQDPSSFMTCGMFLHPAIDLDLDESVTIQGHEIRFATVDLAATSSAVLDRLLALVSSWHRL